MRLSAGGVWQVGEPVALADNALAALALASGLDMRPLAALCHLGMAKLHQRMGAAERAREHLSTATTMLGDMGMRLWLEEAGALSKA